MESILSFDQPLNISTLDQLLLKQHDNKVSVVLNQFIQHPLAWSKVGELLKPSNSDNIRFFGLTVLENNVIKKQLTSLNQQQKESILKELMGIVFINDIPQITQTQAQTTSLKGLLRKKSASLISQILIKEWSSNVNNIQFVEGYISKLLEFIDTTNNSNSNNIQIIEGVFNIFKNLASYIKQEEQYKSMKDLENVFNLIFSKSFLFLQNYQQNGGSNAGLIIEILNTISLMWELVSLDYLFQGNTLLYLIVQGIDNNGAITIKNTFIQVLYEHINSLVLKGNEITLSNNINIIQEFNNKIKELVPVIFKSIVEKCSNYINSGGNNNAGNSSLLENITLLFTVYLKNYLIIFECLPELKDIYLYAEKFIIEIIPNLPTDRSIPCLEYINSLYKSFINSNNSNTRLSIHSQYIPNLFNSIFKVLNHHNEEVLEDGGNGILYEYEINSSTNEEEDEEEWNKISKLLSEILESIGSIYFNDSFEYYKNKLATLLNSPIDSQNISKLGVVFWCIGYLFKYSIQFEKINQFLGELINNKNGNETIIMGLLFIIRNSTTYLKYQDNSQFIKEIITYILSTIQSSASSNNKVIMEMSIHTLSIIVEIRNKLIQIMDYPNLHQFLNQILLNIQNQLITQQINEIYLIIGNLLYYCGASGSNINMEMELTNILQPLNLKLKSCNLDNDNDRNTINNILSSNISLAKSLKSLFKFQMAQLSPVLIELFKWSNVQSGSIFEKYSGSIISFKKNIIEIINLYLKECQQQQQQDLNGLQIEILKYSELLYSDPIITSPVYKVEILPKTLTLIITVINTFKGTLSKQLQDYLIEPFFNISLQEAAEKSSTSKGLQLLTRIWELVNTIQLNNPVLLIGKVSNYIQLINYCFSNISPSIHGSALESLSNYFSNIKTVPNEIIVQIFDFELLLKEFDLVLNLFLNSEYQSSIDKIIKLLFIIINLANNNQDAKIKLMKDFKERTAAIDTKIQQLFNNSNSLEIFENNIKLVK